MIPFPETNALNSPTVFYAHIPSEVLVKEKILTL